MDFPYQHQIARQLIDLDRNQAAMHRETNMLVGGRRVQPYVQSGTNGSFPSLLFQPQAVAEYGGFQFMKKPEPKIAKAYMSDSEDDDSDDDMTGGRRRFQKGSKSITHPGLLDFHTHKGDRFYHQNGHYIHEDVDPYESTGGKRHFRKGSKSRSRPGHLDFMTHRGSKYHDVGGHFVKGLGVPFIGGKHKTNIGKSILHGLEAFDKSNLGQGLERAAIDAGTVALMAAGRGRKPKIHETLKRAAKTTIKGVKDFANSELGQKFGEKALNFAEKYALRKAGLESPQNAIPVLAHVEGKGRTKRKTTARHELVRKLMKEHHLTLPQASSYIKTHKLY
jgi:hypothetical protein